MAGRAPIALLVRLAALHLPQWYLAVQSVQYKCMSAYNNFHWTNGQPMLCAVADFM